MCFNTARTLGPTLDSVLGQQGVEVDSIVIDGGSTDGTQDVIQRYAQHLAHWVSAPDCGTYDAMNKGLAAATGDVVCFLNAEDRYAHPGVLAAVAQTFAQTKASVVAGAVRQHDAAGRTTRIIPSVGFKPRDLWRGSFPPHPATFIRRGLAQRVGAFDLQFRIAADFDYFVRMAADRTFSFAAVDEPLVDMAVGGASTQGLRSYAAISGELVRVMRKHHARASPALIYARGLWKLPQLLARTASTSPAPP